MAIPIDAGNMLSNSFQAFVNLALIDSLLTPQAHDAFVLNNRH